VVRISLGLGCCLPDSAKGIAITCINVDDSTTQSDVENWIDSALARGEEKVTALSEVRPGWLRLCSLTLNDDQGKVSHGLWGGSPAKYSFKELGGPQGLITIASSLAAIAMGWALRHPEEAKSALNDWSDEDRSQLFDTLSDAPSGAEQALHEFTENNYESWVKMAQDSINLWSDTKGHPDFDDPTTWRNQ